MSKSLSSVFFSQICRDQDFIFYLTHQSTKAKMLHTNKNVCNTFSTQIDFMKAPAALIYFSFKVAKNIWKKKFCLNFYLCSSGDV